MKEKKVDRSRILYVGVIVFLCLVFVVGFWYGLDTVLKMEGAYPPVVNEEGLMPAPASNEEGVNFLQTVSQSAVTSKPKAERRFDISIDGDTLECTGSGEMKSTLLYLKENAEKSLDDMVPDASCDFGEEFKDYFIPVITADNVESVECSYIYYECPGCGETRDDAADNCEVCGGVNPYNMKYRDEYTVTLHIKPEATPAVSPVLIKEGADAQLNELCSGMAKITALDTEYTSLEIVYKVNRLTNQLREVSYNSGISAKAAIDFENEYSVFDKTDVSFEMTESVRYNFTYPGLSLNKHKMSIEPGATENLLATLSCSDPTKPVVTWKCSDESKATVDEEGYIKATKETGTVTVSAAFEFQGVTYTDECELFVGYSVESASLSKRKLSLAKGQSEQLTAKVSPSKATNQKVTWYTRDESVATVDQNGVVTAVGSGKTQIYVLSDDEFFRSTCEVTVK